MKMKTEGIAELKELDRVIPEGAAIKKECDVLREEKKELEILLSGKHVVQKRYLSISKSKQEAILKQHYNCESAEIDKITVGTSRTTPTVYPSSLGHALLLDTEITIRTDTLLYDTTKDKSVESV
jgi:hypothetical protein